MSNIQLLTAYESVESIKQSAKEYFLSGQIDQLEAWRNMTAISKAIEELKRDREVMDAALYALSKHGTTATLYGCRMEQRETGARYDYTACGDNELLELYALKSEVDERIKEREGRLRLIRPGSVLVDEQTGESFTAPAKSSTTTIQVIFLKHQSK